MNSVCSFRLCTLSDEDLINKIDETTDRLFDQQKIPCRHIPARPNEDYDLLIGELLIRFKLLKNEKESERSGGDGRRKNS